MKQADCDCRNPRLDGATMWRAVEARDRCYDGQFVFAVATTGVYCRPSCGARRALRRNVSFHATCDDAERAGYRACKRCEPRDIGPAAKDTALVLAACRTIEDSPSPPSLSELARHAGLSRFHFQRLFARVAGVTPAAYAEAIRRRRVSGNLRNNETITRAALEAGFNSTTRFYESADALLGMPVRAYRAGGAGMKIAYTCASCSLGHVLVATTDAGVCAILIGDDADELASDLRRRFPKAAIVSADRPVSDVIAAVVGMIDEPARTANLPLDIHGTAFQQRVWQALRQIPPGRTMSYGELARTIGAPNAVRAVASACGANPLAVAVPCHRVVARDGSLVGYRWGVDRKRELLRRETDASADHATPGPLKRK